MIRGTRTMLAMILAVASLAPPPFVAGARFMPPLLMARPSLAAPLSPPFVTDTPVIDGRLDEALWASALKYEDFLQRVPTDGSEPTERTLVHLLYSSDALYVGVRMFDSQPDRIRATVLKRDDFTAVRDDQIAFAIDSYNDKRNGFWFSTNPLGARADTQFFNEGHIWEENWNGVWDCDATIDSTGWVAEFEIPFSTLRFVPSSQNVMGMNFFRRIIRTNEQLYAPLISTEYPFGTPTVSLAREIAFDDISGGRSARLKPYALMGARTLDATSDLHTDLEREIGLDARYDLTSSLTANLSINTDFAQAEADERQVNLTRFSLFFPEKRDFFLENAGTYKFGLPEEADIYFSRRIGLVETPAGAVGVPIRAGAKLTGKLGATDLGVMNVQTGASGDRAAENFSVARLKWGFAPRSYMGAVFTQRLGDIDGRVYGLDGTVYPHGNIGVTAFGATREAEARWDPAQASVAYASFFRTGERASFDLHALEVGPEFLPDIGFVTRRDIRKLHASGKLPWYANRAVLRRFMPGYAFTEFQTRSGDRLDTTHHATIDVDFQSDDRTQLFATHDFTTLIAPFPIAEGITVPVGTYETLRGGLSVTSKEGRPLQLILTVADGQFFDGERLQVSASAEWTPSKHLSLGQFYEFNAVDLGAGAFDAHLARSKVRFSLNTHLTASTLVQYDNATRQLSFNFRASYLIAEGREVFVVFDTIRDGVESGDLLGARRSEVALVKFTYLLTF